MLWNGTARLFKRAESSVPATLYHLMRIGHFIKLYHPLKGQLVCNPRIQQPRKKA